MLTKFIEMIIKHPTNNINKIWVKDQNNKK